jgi:hypothetical protein
MKNLIRFVDFLNDKILEKMELKISNLELILSPKLIKILKEMKHVIADELLKLHMDSEPKYQMTFVDLGTNSDELSFIQSNKVSDFIEHDIVHGDYHKEYKNVIDKQGKTSKEFIGGYYNFVPLTKNPWISDVGHIPDLHDVQFKSKEHPVWTKNRSDIKVGRFVTKIFPDIFPANRKREELSKMSKPNDVESFVNMFIASVESHAKKLTLVKGEDIRHWYDGKNYFKESGTLHNSCMRGSEKSSFFDLYCKNPEKIEMLVLFPEDIRNKIMGRAIVWHLDEPEGRVYMDRIYTNNDSDEYMFIEYAKRNGWLYKSSQAYGWDYNIVDGKTGNSKRMAMNVQLKPGSYQKYPYVDTLQYYNPTTGLMTSDGHNVNDKFFKLNNTEGNPRPYNAG